MICPYNNISETQVQTWEQKLHDESETPKSGKTVTQTIWKQLECQRENCGAFWDGICHYKN